MPVSDSERGAADVGPIVACASAGATRGKAQSLSMVRESYIVDYTITYKQRDAPLISSKSGASAFNAS